MPVEYDLRLDCLARCLRYFSLSDDDFAIHELLRGSNLPTQEQIEHRLDQNDALKGRQFTSHHVADVIVNALLQLGTLPSQLTYTLESQPWYGPLPQEEEVASRDANKVSVDVILITAVRVELEAVLRCLQPLAAQQHIWRVVKRKETYFFGRFGEQNAVVTMCRMGAGDQGSSLAATFKAIDSWKPKAVIMVGIAFGKDAEQQAIADVLVSSQVICYDLKRVGKDGKITYRGSTSPCGATLLNRFRNTLDWRFKRPDGTECQHKDGPILSGQVLVDNNSFKSKLFQEFPQAIGGEMEAVGVYAASEELNTEWIIVKAICDWAGGQKSKSDQPLAAAAAASLVHSVLSKRLALEDLYKPALDEE